MEIRINLLPPYRKEEIVKSKKIKTVAKLEVFIFLMIITFFSFLLSFSYILRLNLSSVPNNLGSKDNQERYERVKEYDRQFMEINNQLSDANKIKSDQLYWSKLLMKLSEKVPDGIEITNLLTKNYGVSLVGRADNRDRLVGFKEELEEDACFTDISLPLSNLVSKENIDFQIDLKMKEECLKKQ